MRVDRLAAWLQERSRRWEIRREGERKRREKEEAETEARRLEAEERSRLKVRGVYRASMARATWLPNPHNPLLAAGAEHRGGSLLTITGMPQSRWVHTVCDSGAQCNENLSLPKCPSP